MQGKLLLRLCPHALWAPWCIALASNVIMQIVTFTKRPSWCDGPASAWALPIANGHDIVPEPGITSGFKLLRVAGVLITRVQIVT